jgi:hypothetical protein
MMEVKRIAAASVLDINLGHSDSNFHVLHSFRSGFDAVVLQAGEFAASERKSTNEIATILLTRLSSVVRLAAS